MILKVFLFISFLVQYFLFSSTHTTPFAQNSPQIYVELCEFATKTENKIVFIDIARVKAIFVYRFAPLI